MRASVALSVGKWPPESIWHPAVWAPQSDWTIPPSRNRNPIRQFFSPQPSHHTDWTMSWVDTRQARRKIGNLASQSLWCDAKTFRRCSSIALMYRSTIPQDCGHSRRAISFAAYVVIPSGDTIYLRYRTYFWQSWHLSSLSFKQTSWNLLNTFRWFSRRVVEAKGHYSKLT
jgi:hypothetical protein